jgi:hypothetical protein
MTWNDGNPIIFSSNWYWLPLPLRKIKEAQKGSCCLEKCLFRPSIGYWFLVPCGSDIPNNAPAVCCYIKSSSLFDYEGDPWS